MDNGDPVRESRGRSTSAGKKGRSKKLFGRAPERHTDVDRPASKTVKKMPYTDQFGDFGFYTGQVNDVSRPHGKGSMKYDNGVFYEGTWTDGCQDQQAASQYNRIRGGFTSWQGKGSHATKSGMVLPWNARRNDAPDLNAKTNVRGMEWTDLNGHSGRYTGEINSSKLPHGMGIMKYDFGLIAEGDWNEGILKEGPNDRLLSAAASASGVMSVGGGMSVGPGLSLGGPVPVCSSAMSVGPGSTYGGRSFVGGGMPMMYNQGNPSGINPMMNRGMSLNPQQQHMIIAQQNAAMKSMGGSVYGGGSVHGGSVYSGFPPMPMQAQPLPMPMQMQAPMQASIPMQTQIQGGMPLQNKSEKPPMSEIKFSQS